MQLLVGIIGAIIGATIAGLSTYLIGRTQMRRELEYAYDRDLRARRIVSYISLYKLTGNMPRYWPTGNPARSDLLNWGRGLDDWYFGEAGGLFLSDPARQTYLQLLDVMGAITNVEDRSDSLLSEEEVQRLWRAGQALRRQLAADVGAAENPRVTGRQPWQSPPPGARFRY